MWIQMILPLITLITILGMLDVIDMEGLLQGDEEHVSGWDLVYDNGFIEIDPTQCGYTTFLGK